MTVTWWGLFKLCTKDYGSTEAFIKAQMWWEKKQMGKGNCF